MSLLILAVEDGLLFDSAFARHMRLPFTEGWNHWEVYAREVGSRNLVFRGEFDRLEFAEAYMSAASPTSQILPSAPKSCLGGESPLRI